MPYVVSRLANDQAYTDWSKPDSSHAKVARPATPRMKVVVKGGAGVMGVIHTPDGVMTKITDAEAEMLIQNSLFKKHAEKGLVKVLAREPNVEEVAADLKEDAGEVVAGVRKSGGSAPLSEKRGDFKKGGRAGGKSEEEAKTII
jgi:hypothetical protein